MQTKKIKGIIVSKNPYLDNDQMLKVLTEYTLINIYAKGVRKIESKNRSNVNIGSMTEFEVFKSYSTPNSVLLKKAVIINGLPEITKTNAEKIEILIKIISSIKYFHPEIYNVYDLLLKDFESVNYFKIQSFLISKILESNGEQLSFSFCVNCSSNQNLFSFDVSQGGMLCKKHGKYETPVKLLKSFYFMGESLEKYIDSTSAEINQQIFQILSNLLF